MRNVIIGLTLFTSLTSFADSFQAGVKKTDLDTEFTITRRIEDNNGKLVSWGETITIKTQSLGQEEIKAVMSALSNATSVKTTNSSTDKDIATPCGAESDTSRDNVKDLQNVVKPGKATSSAKKQ